ncbi:aconitase family protein, partial [Pseudomonas sp.]|uniref:aconitase family protein n=1 Tax=Pseudomonas sp. TaxID=306 RepID=UPI0031D5FD6B
MFEAARFGDEISHTSALGGFLIGAALGIALVATVAIATFTCGFGVALLAGLAAGIGGSLLTAAGEAIGSMFSSPSGTITTTSPNVFINCRKAARVALVEKYSKAQGLFATRSTPDPVFTDTLELDLTTVQASMAGPKRPEGRADLGAIKSGFAAAMENDYK